ncbi:hypothetical protein T440DRAFT_480113 [Plenodomus tracheiphilus IPT5]|uniref:Uncharacterized protein n=1 Tax=Plenodomus tracheiphilus IPT5 TaxID=1408161 RepID=A0A6A7B251_9PLEO|nr:hypothetical protein T440DRAFT_480113 [Plenodomus tracheiphilus IPT5]
MPRFLRRIFSNENPFRTPPTATRDDIQRSRRVLVRNSTAPLEVNWRTSFLYLETNAHAEEHTALRDGGTSVADSASQPILASRHEAEQAQPRARRRLSCREIDASFKMKQGYDLKKIRTLGSYGTRLRTYWRALSSRLFAQPVGDFTIETRSHCQAVVVPISNIVFQGSVSRTNNSKKAISRNYLLYVDFSSYLVARM